METAALVLRIAQGALPSELVMGPGPNTALLHGELKHNVTSGNLITDLMNKWMLLVEACITQQWSQKGVRPLGISSFGIPRETERQLLAVGGNNWAFSRASTLGTMEATRLQRTGS